MADIFLSYASQDRERVLPLVELLQDDGYSIWWDRNIPPGPTSPDTGSTNVPLRRTDGGVFGASRPFRGGDFFCWRGNRYTGSPRARARSRRVASSRGRLLCAITRKTIVTRKINKDDAIARRRASPSLMPAATNRSLTSPIV